MKWVSASKLNLSLVGLVGVAGFVFALKRDGVVWSFGDLSSLFRRKNHLEAKYSVAGLQNLGNNCFLNVVLQALASCSCFQPFVHKVLDECEMTVAEERAEMMPLTLALDDLFEELCISADRRVVLSPRRVMLEMAHYIPNFNLTSQQDAAEALLHLLSSLREEFSEWYVPVRSPLAVVSDTTSRVLSSKGTDSQSEQKRWQKHFLGPFDGIIRSFLTCQSCSSQISLNFELFQTLLLSPVLCNGSTIIGDCTLRDCLKQFVAAERVANYHCSRCWHIAAAKYLSLVRASEMDIMKLKSCSGGDFCDCQNQFNLEMLPWSNDFSRTIRQSTIARPPEILCIQLQRASVNEFGEPLKLQGHISFPLVLDLSPYTTNRLGMQIRKGSVPAGQGNLNNQQISPLSMQSSAHIDSESHSIWLRGLFDCEFGSVMSQKPFKKEGDVGYGPSSSNLCNDECMESHCKDVMPQASKSHCYCLVSVVEHFGRTGSGHYTVYRRVRTEPPEEENQPRLETASEQWFYISDSEVYNVSESDVLAAEASLLFYERLV
ncbi:ubiquitin carboxyl-terminal hydrolase 27-like isoform X1 [Rhodamnia argentea]|uniref:Ubiquitin carboxyl-terminal hydrolase n=1 Tax=Rhodamnia argentea TaxID=178133 RepID=A0A8B8N310_9MYRT|nr:ubiquitin carboxyl-terminal hydrolase 27-like isoform X1 [Rhodamnia argentea]